MSFMYKVYGVIAVILTIVIFAVFVLACIKVVAYFNTADVCLSHGYINGKVDDNLDGYCIRLVDGSSVSVPLSKVLGK